MAATTVSVIALAGCGDETTPAADTPEQKGVLALLASDAKGSLAKVVDRATKSKTVTLKMEGTAAGETVKGEGVVLYGDDPRAQLTMQAGGETTEIRIIGSVIYLAIPEGERAEMEGKAWMKMDLSAAGDQAGASFTKQLEDIDPVKQVKALLAADSVTVVGEEEVNGVKTVHYTVTQPVTTYLGQVDEKSREAVEKELGKHGVTEVKIDLWVDEQYQPRRAHAVMGKASDMTVDYSDYGKAVTVEAPPAGEVLDFAQMLEGLKPKG